MIPSRISYVVNAFPKLSETFIANELIELKRRGIDLQVFSLRKPAESFQHDFIGLAGLNELCCYDSENFLSAIRSRKPQLLHAHFATEPAAAARDLAKATGVPFTFTTHGYDIFRKPPDDFAARAMAAAGVITVSHANADYIHRTFDVPLRHLHVISCGVDIVKFCPTVATDWSEEERLPLIVCVARLVKVKNLPLLLRACALLQKDPLLRFKCVLVGDGPCREELEALSAGLHLQHVVTFEGAADQSDVLRWWQRADVAVLSSENEGMPVCLMEAASCGLPAVAPRVGGIPELVVDGVTGILTKPNDPASLAEALRTLLLNPGLRQNMGRAARSRAENILSLARQVDQMIELWRGILHDHR